MTDTSKGAVERLVFDVSADAANINNGFPFRGEMGRKMQELGQVAVALLAENQRMREALEDVSGVGFDAPMTWAGTDAEWERKRANAMQAAARAALKGDKT